jgi:hypothetical protein
MLPSISLVLFEKKAFLSFLSSVGKLINLKVIGIKENKGPLEDSQNQP